MRIVYLDSHTLNPEGDLSWDAFKALGDFTAYDRTPKDKIIERAQGADIVLTNKCPLDRATIAALPSLRYIGVAATGYNVIDVAAADEYGIVVSNVPAYGTAEVAQATMALLLELTNRVGHHSDMVRNGKWSECPDFCFADAPLVGLSGLKMGIIGFGLIGQEVAKRAHAFGMKIIAPARTSRAETDYPVWYCGLEDLFSTADVISLHCQLNETTKSIVNADHLNLMKKSAFLLNTSRGPLVDEVALAEALNAGRIAGAGLDVLSVEPPNKDNPLLSAKNCIITPHISWAAFSARQKLLGMMVENIEAFQSERPINAVNATKPLSVRKAAAHRPG